MARRGIALLVLMLALGACSSSSPSKASVGKTAAEATQRCNAYEKAHYPRDRVHVGVMSPNVVCIIDAGGTCIGPDGNVTLASKQIYVKVAKNGTGHAFQVVQAACKLSLGSTTTTVARPLRHTSTTFGCTPQMQGCGVKLAPFTTTTTAQRR